MWYVLAVRKSSKTKVHKHREYTVVHDDMIRTIFVIISKDIIKCALMTRAPPRHPDVTISTQSAGTTNVNKATTNGMDFLRSDDFSTACRQVHAGCGRWSLIMFDTVVTTGAVERGVVS